MADWKRYTPDGTQDVLPRQCANKMKIEATIADVFESYGYQVAETPVMQFYDAFSTQSGKIPQETMFKFFDAEGRILVLRPDITTCLARMVACKLDDGIYPKRLYYCGKVFRYLDQNTAGEREFCQAGIELFGVKSDLADSEIISCAIESLLSVGLKRFQIEIGQVAFFKALMAQANLSDDDIESLRILIDKKDSLAIGEFLKHISIDSELASLLEELPSLFGGLEVLEKLSTYELNRDAKEALQNLKEVYKILSEYGYEDYISIDLSLVQGINRYTGIIFKGITHGIGYSICAGGRYDGLTGEFGKSLPAVGMAIGTDRLLTVLSRQGSLDTAIGADFLVVCRDHALSRRVASALRESGYVVELALSDLSQVEHRSYAKNNSIQGVLTISDNENAEIYNVENDETVPVSLDELFDHDEDCQCGHCH